MISAATTNIHMQDIPLFDFIPIIREISYSVSYLQEQPERSVRLLLQVGMIPTPRPDSAEIHVFLQAP